MDTLRDNGIYKRSTRDPCRPVGGATPTVAPQVYVEATARIAEAFTGVEAKRGVVIPDAIRLFLSNAVSESLHLYGDAWRRRFKVDPASNADAHAIGEQVFSSMYEVLSNAEAEANGVPQITFVGVLAAIHARWCKVFPFCKA